MADSKSKIDGMLSKLPPSKLYELIGEITSLMIYSPIHSHFTIIDLPDIILPPINLNQFRIYKNSKGKPIGLITWACFSAEVEKEYLKGKTLMSLQEWSSGEIIYITDFIAPFGHTKKIANDLKKNIFPNKLVKSWRFTETGKHRSTVSSFKGINYKNLYN